MKLAKSITAKVNDQFDFKADQLSDIDIVPIDDRHFHLLSEGKSYRSELISTDHNTKTFVIKINGSKYTIQLFDAYDVMVDRLGLGKVNTKAAKDIMAPMPGLVLKMMVKDGEQVSEGQAVLILEAMKMENVIKANADGTVASIAVKQGDAVEKGQLMIKMEE